MTAGSYIKSLLEKKDVSLSSLTKKLGLKSRSALYRLFSDYYSLSKTKELIEQIKQFVPFDEEESERLNMLLGSDTVSSFFKKTRSVLSSLMKDEPDMGYVIECEDGSRLILKDLLNKYSRGNTDIIISGLDDEKMIGDIHSLLSVDHRTRVHAYLKLKYHRLMTAYEILSLIVLASYENYIPYICDYVMYKGICILSEIDSEYYLVSMNSSNLGNGFVETKITKQFYDYIMGNHGRLIKKYPCIRMPVNKVSDYIEYSKIVTENENGEMLYAEGAPCFGNLKFSILEDMFRQIDYFGFPQEHVYVKSLIEIFRQKEKNRQENTGFIMNHLFDFEHMKYMMQTGIAFDHLDLFAPMSSSQCAEYFDYFYKLSENSDNRINYRFYKGEMLRYPFVYKMGSLLYLYSSSSESGRCGMMLIDNSGVIEIMDDFAAYIWSSYTYSDKESKEELIKLIRKNFSAQN